MACIYWFWNSDHANSTSPSGLCHISFHAYPRPALEMWNSLGLQKCLPEVWETVLLAGSFTVKDKTHSVHAPATHPLRMVWVSFCVLRIGAHKHLLYRNITLLSYPAWPLLKSHFPVSSSLLLIDITLPNNVLAYLSLLLG